MLHAVIAMLALHTDETARYALAPRYALGQELTYVGIALERQTGTQGAVYEQPYDLEATVLASRSNARKETEVCAFTTLRLPSRDRDPEAGPFDDVAGFRFDHLLVRPNGAAAWLAGPRKGQRVANPAEGWANGELGFVLEIPAEPLAVGSRWVVKRVDAPDLECVATGTEIAEGEPCVRVTCVEESRNWRRADTRSAWRATSTLWLGQNRGLAVRVRRDTLIRQPGEAAASRSVSVRYALASNIVYNGPQLLDRVADFELAARVQGEYEKLALGKTELPARATLGILRNDLKLALEQQARATGYRPALRELYRAVGDAETGLAQRRPPAPAPGAFAVAALGQPARSWTVKDLAGQRHTPKSLKGRAVALVFVNPDSSLSRKALGEVLAAAQRTPAGMPRPEVLAVCPKADEATAKRLKADVPGDYRVCQAQSADRAYGIRSLPHVLAIDAEGILRANFVGYGPELPGIVAGLNAKPLAPALGGKDTPAAK